MSLPVPGDIVSWVSDSGVEHRDFGIVVDHETVLWRDEECNADNFCARSGLLTTVLGSIRTVYRPITEGWRRRLVDDAVRRLNQYCAAEEE